MHCKFGFRGRVGRGWRTAPFVALVSLGVAAGAAAQPVLLSTIEKMGTATVDVPPDYVTFWLHKEATGSTFVEAVRASLEFGPVLRKELAKQELGPFELTLSAPAIPDTEKRGVWVSAQVQLSMNPFNNRETGPEMFAAVCDKMAALAPTLECFVEGPILGVQDPSAVEQAAVGLATENALPLAQAIAELMNSQIVAVDHVIVEECVWNADPDTKATLPDMRRITCTARVRVTYAFSATAE